MSKSAQLHESGIFRSLYVGTHAMAVCIVLRMDARNKIGNLAEMREQLEQNGRNDLSGDFR